LEKSEKKRRENFVNDRIKILKNLEIREKYWGMTSTIDKLNQLDTYKKKESLKSL
jgi:MoaA/NifB/PqqE/SkfB family radical SAM enzyme